MSSPLNVIPLEPEEISRDWLFEVINQFRLTRNLSLVKSPNDIVDCAIDERDQSHGYLSTTYKLVAHFKCQGEAGSEECSYAFFLKMMPGVEDRHKKLVSKSKVFQKEVEALFKYLPSIKKFAGGLKLPLPTIVYGSHDSTGSSGVIVMMDANDVGYFPLSHYSGFQLCQLLTIVGRLGQFHAVSTAKLLESREFREEIRETEQSQQICCETIFKDFAKFVKKVPGFYPCYDRLEKIRPKLNSLLSSGRKTPAKFPLKTVLHGELWDKNILIMNKPGNSKIEDIILCDWKRLKLGFPAEDLTLLILSSASTSVIKGGIEQVLEKYLFEFSSTLKEHFHIDFEKNFPDFTLSEFREDFENALMGAFLQAATIMTREIRYLEVEFHNAESEEQQDELGLNLRNLGRRLLELADEFVPMIDLEMNNINNDNNGDRVHQQQRSNNFSSSMANSKVGITA